MQWMQTAVYTLLSFLFANMALAEEGNHQKSINHFLTQLGAQLGAPLQIKSIQPSTGKGVFTVALKSGELLHVYLAPDGKQLLLGTLLERDGNNIVNVTEQQRKQMVVKYLKSVPAEKMITYSPAEEPKAVMTVFTDVSCGYCRKLHRDIPALNKLGVEVRYLAFPRGGVNSPAYVTMMSAWCSDNPEEAMNQAKQGKTLSPVSCPDNPVQEQYLLGLQMGVNATPTTYLQDGTLVQGYRPPEQMAQILRIQSSN